MSNNLPENLEEKANYLLLLVHYAGRAPGTRAGSWQEGTCLGQPALRREQPKANALQATQGPSVLPPGCFVYGTEGSVQKGTELR